MKIQKKIILSVLFFALFMGGCNEVQKHLQPVLETAQEYLPSLSWEKERKVIESISNGCYAYNTLDDETKKTYDEILQVILEHQESTEVSTKSVETLDLAYRAIFADYGGVFWVSGYSYCEYRKKTVPDQVYALEFFPNYTKTKEERDLLQTQIDGKTEQVLQGISAEMSDFEKAKYVYDYLAQNVTYVRDAEENQNIISVFLNQQTVCQGYASAMQYLLEKAGIQSMIVTGHANGEPHAWNVVQLDGEYYYMDVTAALPSEQLQQKGLTAWIDYSYFAVMSAEIETHYKVDDFMLVPNCTAIDNNYHVHEGLFFTEWEPEKIKVLLQESFENEENIFTVKFASKELYEKASQYLIEEGNIMNMGLNQETFYYIVNDDMKVLTFFRK